MPSRVPARLWGTIVVVLVAAQLVAHASGSRNVRTFRPRRPRRSAAAPLPPTSKALVCAGCGVECSSEVSFIDHINGAAHRKRAGVQGFVGLLPNSDGVISILFTRIYF